MLVHDSKWVGQSCISAQVCFWMQVNIYQLVGCIWVYEYTHTHKKGNRSHTHTHTLQGPRMMVRGNEVTQPSRMVAVHSPVSTVRCIHLYNTLVDSFLAKIKAYLTQVWRPAAANMNFGWWLSVSTETKLCVERKPTVSLCSHSSYQGFLKNIACKFQCLWPNLYIFSVIYSYSSFFFFLCTFSVQFCTVLFSCNGRSQRYRALEVFQCYREQESYFLYPEQSPWVILLPVPSRILMKTPVFNIVFVHTFAEPESYIQITQVVFNKL